MQDGSTISFLFAGKKKKQPDDSKKKKISKKDGEIKEIKKKIKLEPQENSVQLDLITKETDKIQQSAFVKKDNVSTSSIPPTDKGICPKEKVIHDVKSPKKSEVHKQQEERSTSKSESKTITNDESG